MTTGWTVRDRIPVGARFSACPDQPWGPRSLLYNGYRVFPGGKVWPGHAADHSPTLQCCSHGRVELYLYPPSGPHRPCNGITLPYFTYFENCSLVGYYAMSSGEELPQLTV